MLDLSRLVLVLILGRHSFPDFPVEPLFFFKFFFLLIRISFLRSFSKLRARCGHRISGRQMRRQGLHVLRR